MCLSSAQTPAQQGSPVPPQCTHEPPLQAWSLIEHMSPAQQGWSLPPQAVHVPLLQIWVAPLQSVPPQQRWPFPPQGSHFPVLGLQSWPLPVHAVPAVTAGLSVPSARGAGARVADVPARAHAAGAAGVSVPSAARAGPARARERGRVSTRVPGAAGLAHPAARLAGPSHAQERARIGARSVRAAGLPRAAAGRHHAARPVTGQPCVARIAGAAGIAHGAAAGAHRPHTGEVALTGPTVAADLTHGATVHLHRAGARHADFARAGAGRTALARRTHAGAADATRAAGAWGRATGRGVDARARIEAPASVRQDRAGVQAARSEQERGAKAKESEEDDWPHRFILRLAGQPRKDAGSSLWRVRSRERRNCPTPVSHWASACGNMPRFCDRCAGRRNHPGAGSVSARGMHSIRASCDRHVSKLHHLRFRARTARRCSGWGPLSRLPFDTAIRSYEAGMRSRSEREARNAPGASITIACLRRRAGVRAVLVRVANVAAFPPSTPRPLVAPETV